MNPATPSPADTVAALVGLFGPWGAVAGLAIHFGTPFVMQLIQNAQNKVPVTDAEWTKLADKIAISGESLIPQRPPSAGGTA